MEILTVTQLRGDLRGVLDRVKSGRVIGVGAHRRPEAVMLPMESYERLTNSSHDMMPSLLNKVAIAESALMIRDQGHSTADFWLGPGDSFGRIVAWLWDTGQAGPMSLMVAELLTNLRANHPDELKAGPIAFEELLRGIEESLPFGAAGDEIVVALRAQVPGFFPESHLTRQ